MVKRKEKSIYRESALKRLTSPEELDQLIVVVGSKGWMGLICILFLLLMLSIWMAFATIPVKTTLKGIILTPQGKYAVHPIVKGSVDKILVRKGDHIEKNQVIAILSDNNIDQDIENKTSEINLLKTEIDTKEKNQNSSLIDLKIKLNIAENELDELKENKKNLLVRSPYAGTIDRFQVNLGDLITPENDILILELDLKTNEKLQAYGFVALEYRDRIVPGLPANINVITYDPNDRENYKGKVVYVSPFALSKVEILQRYGHLSSFNYLAPEDTPLLEVQVDPETNNTLKSGQFCTIQITIDHKKPWHYLFL